MLEPFISDLDQSRRFSSRKNFPNSERREDVDWHLAASGGVPVMLVLIPPCGGLWVQAMIMCVNLRNSTRMTVSKIDMTVCISFAIDKFVGQLGDSDADDPRCGLSFRGWCHFPQL